MSTASQSGLPSLGKDGKTSAKLFGGSMKRTVLALPFKKNIFGDVFGTHMELDNSLNGMMYKCRVRGKAEGPSVRKAGENVDENESDAGRKVHDKNIALESTDALDSGSDSDTEVREGMNPLLQLTKTFRNWSSHEENDTYLLREGGVKTLALLAQVEDDEIRRSVVSAFYQLSSRPVNREELINLKVTKGVVSISVDYRNYRIAKLCALTLCNLSIQGFGEKTMAEENVAFAVQILQAVRGQRLLPICVQTLYNLTCVDRYYGGLPKIINMIINTPLTGFDHLIYATKSLVNCCRFPWMRARIIEDGALSSLSAFGLSIKNRKDKVESAFLVATCLRLLSDPSENKVDAAQQAAQKSAGFKSDMISKGAIGLILSMIGYCDERARLLFLCAIHNLLQVPQIPFSIFESAVDIVTSIILQTSDGGVLQYGSACLYMILKDHQRQQRRLCLQIIDSITKLLGYPEPLTEYFSINAAGKLFAMGRLISEEEPVESLVSKFVDAMPQVQDVLAIQASCVAMVNLTQTDYYTAMLMRLDLQYPILKQLVRLLDGYNDTPDSSSKPEVIQESACTAICRLAITLDSLPDEMPRCIANVMVALLEAKNICVLRSTISSIRALGEAGLCHEELLCDQFLHRIANIVVRYQSDVPFVRNCIAVLAVFSSDKNAHLGLGSDAVIDVLFVTASSDDRITRELVATAFCNISFNEVVRARLTHKGINNVLAMLSGSTSEVIQELCAKCICNMSCTKDLHKLMIEEDALGTLLMIALVRSVAMKTKKLCARALLNLSIDQNIDGIKAAGAVRIFAGLSSIPNQSIQLLCARGFLVFSGNATMREEMVKGQAILQALYGMAKLPAIKVRRLVGIAISNLLVCEKAQVSAIDCGALGVLRILATMEIDNLTQSIARVSVSLSTTVKLRSYLQKQSLIPAVVLYLQNPSESVFECSLYALSAMCQVMDFHNALVEKGCVSALVGAVISGRIDNPRLAKEVCRCLCLLSYNEEKAEAMTIQSNVALAMHIIYHCGYMNPEIATMVALTLQNLSAEKKVRRHLVQHDCLKLLTTITQESRAHDHVLYRAALVFMDNLAKVHELHEDLLSQGLMTLLYRIKLVATIEREDLSLRLSDINARKRLTNGPVTTTENPFSTALEKITETPGISEHLDIPFKELPEFTKPSREVSLDVPDRDAELLCAIDPTFFEPMELAETDVKAICRTIFQVAHTDTCHRDIADSKVVDLFAGMMENYEEFVLEYSLTDIAGTLALLAASKECRQQLADEGATDLLIKIAMAIEGNKQLENRTQTQVECKLALGRLSELTYVKPGNVSALMVLQDGNVEKYFKERKSGKALDALNTTIEETQVKSTGGSSQKRHLRDFAKLGKQNLEMKKKMIAVTGGGGKGRPGARNVVERENARKSQGSRLSQFTDFRFRTVEEGALLFRTYDGYVYSTVATRVNPEDAGLGHIVSLETLALPTFEAQVERDTECRKRFHALAKVNSVSGPLPKHTTILTEYFGTDDGTSPRRQASARQSPSIEKHSQHKGADTLSLNDVSSSISRGSEMSPNNDMRSEDLRLSHTGSTADSRVRGKVPSRRNSSRSQQNSIVSPSLMGSRRSSRAEPHR